MSNSPSFSFELFPPRTDAGVEKMKQNVQELNQVSPEYFSVTHGAGGSTRDSTLSTVQWLNEQKIAAAPHLSCIGSSKQEVMDLLTHYQSIGVKRIIALRGDMPSGMVDIGDFRYASDLVTFIRQEMGDTFHLEVAAYPEFHPQSTSAADDLRHFKEKVDAGANSAITQYFYNPDAYFRFREEVERMGVQVPIVVGIMPISNYVQLARFSDTCGAEIPRWIRKRLEAYGDDLTSIRAFGLDVVSDLCRHLLDNDVAGLHFYTMNQSKNTLDIWHGLSLSDA